MFSRKGFLLLFLLVGFAAAQFDPCTVDPSTFLHTCLYKGPLAYSGDAGTSQMVPGLTIVESVIFQNVQLTAAQSTSILTAFKNLQNLHFDKLQSPSTIGFGILSANSYQTLRNLTITGSLSLLESALDRFTNLQNFTVRSTTDFTATSLSKSLINIDMQYNQGLTLPSNIFSMLSNLKTLNISQSSIKIQPQQFNGLTSLISLSMNLCGLTTIPSGLFDPLIALEMLQLSGNSFATLIAFPSLTNLQYLHLNVSKITTIDANAFLSLPKLRELDLSGNTAITCTEKMFVGLALLSTLKLSNSGLTKESLRPEILAPLVNLTNIDLSLNNFETFHGAVLGKNENLNVIDLTESKIKRIHSNFTDKLRSAEVHLKLKRNLCVDLEFIVLNRDFDRIQHELVACHSPGLAIPKLIILILTIFKIFRFF